LPPKPVAPEARRYTAEEYVNVSPKFHGSTRLSPENIKKKFTVYGPLDQQYLTDAVYFALQQRSAVLVEREGIERVLLEAQTLPGKEVLKAEAPEDEAKRVAGLSKVDYAVIIHVVKDNHTTATPEKVDLPWYIRDQDWEKYQASVQKYYEAYNSYASSINRYNSALSSLVRAYAEKVDQASPAWDQYEAQFKKYEDQYDAYVKQVTGGTSVEPKAPKATERFRVNPPPQALAVAAPPRTAEIEQQILDALARYSFSTISTKSFDKDVVTDKAKLLPDSKAEELITINQFAVSIRVVDMAKSEDVWFGYAETQNLSYVEAYFQCLDLLTERMTGFMMSGK